MAETAERSSCPVSCSLDIWGDKWSLLIVRDLMFFNRNTYSDFLNSGEKIATNILASRLVTLEENGIITKSAHPDSKAKVMYRLTEKGIELLPLMIEIQLWAEKFFQLSPGRKTVLNEIKRDKAGFIRSKKRELKKIHLISTT